MNEQEILDVLIDADVCGGRISPSVMLTGTALPNGRYNVIEIPIDPDFQSTSEIIQIRFNLSIWDKDYNTLYTLKNTIRGLFKGIADQEILSTINEDEGETGHLRLETNWYFTSTN